MRPKAAPLVRAELYGDGEPAIDDPAELFHEASKLHPALVHRQAAGLVRLAANSDLQTAAAHAVRRNLERTAHALPHPLPCDVSLSRAFDLRATRREFAAQPLGVAVVATLLDAAYGVRGSARRTVPSGGALYPLEVLIAVRDVDGLPRGVHRYDAALHALEEQTFDDPWAALEAACPFPGLFAGAACAFLLLAVFGRTRFKYGQRGYRFALLEAGHVAQNVVLAAAALDVAALPLGGYYDAQVDAVAGADGVEESVVYVVVLGTAA